MIDLEHDDIVAIDSYLTHVNWIAPARTVASISKAGDGNMNITRRIRLDNHETLILKQAVPYVAKYPDIPAPIERTEMEAAFYRATARAPEVARLQPRLLGHAANNHLIALEDLGEAADFTDAYATGVLDASDVDLLLGFLSTLHTIPVNAEGFANPAMRKLNHDHLFLIPLDGSNASTLNGITPGLEAVANQLSKDDQLVASTLELGQIYIGRKLAGSPALLHGDFFPGSWLRNPETGIRIIDPEFGFYGPAEFDLGVFVAHCLFIGIEVEPVIEALRGERSRFDESLMRAFAGVELIRRLIGVAQLPLSRTLPKKLALLTLGASWIKDWSTLTTLTTSATSIDPTSKLRTPQQ